MPHRTKTKRGKTYHQTDTIKCPESQRRLSDGDLASVSHYGADGFEIIVENWSVYQNPRLTLDAARILLHRASDALLRKHRDKRRKLNDAHRLGPDARYGEKMAEQNRMDVRRRELNEEFWAEASKTINKMLACKVARDEVQDAFDNGPDERYAYAVEACRAFVCEKCSARAECPVAEREKMT